MSPQGIGGDDRAGVYMILEIIKRQTATFFSAKMKRSAALAQKSS